MNCSQRLFILLVLCLPGLSGAQQSVASHAASQEPALRLRPAPSPGARRIQLDVVVDDKAGRAQSGLELNDFTLLDNGQPAKALSFQAHGGMPADSDPPVQVILLVDMVNTPFSQVAFTRQQIAKFLRRNGGHLAHPVSLYLLTDQGVMAQPAPPTDGIALAADLDQVDSMLRSVGRSAQGMQGAVERFELSLKMVAAIAQSEAKKPGRKVLVWPGPGWPAFDWGLTSPASYHNQVFYSIVGLSTDLREARIELCSMVQAGLNGFASYRFQDFLKGVKTVNKASPSNLDLKVLAIQSGGRALDASNDLSRQIESCIEDAGTYYTLSFDPPRADRPDEYHDLKIVVDKPGLTARTNTGYYNQP